MNNLDNIKPCPFCGEKEIEYRIYSFEAHMYQDTSEAAYECTNCEAKGGSVSVMHKYEYGRDVTDHKSYEREALDNWNKRS